MIAATLPAVASDLQRIIDEAVSRGEKHFLIPPGVHRLAHGLRLNGLSDFILDGTGSTLVFTDLQDGGLQVGDCRGLTLRGFTIDFDPLPFTQATIDTVDASTGEVAFTVQDGYPDLAPQFLGGRALAFAPDTLAWKQNAPDLYASEARAVDARHGLLKFSPDKRISLSSIRPGDYLALDYRNSRGLRIERSSDVLLDGLTFWSAPSIAVVCRYMDGKNVFRYKIERGPLPPGAQVPRLLSTSADGLNYAYARQGPTIEKCDFSYMGDDSVNLHGVAFYVAQADGKTAYLLRPYGEEAFASVIKPGDLVRALTPDSFDIKGHSEVVRFAVERKPPLDFSELAARVWKSAAVKAGKLTVYRLELAAPLELKQGDFLEIPAIAAPGYVIRDSRFHDHRGRGLRLMASDGLVENNILENIKQAAISLGGEFTFFREAGWVDDVTISGNTIRQVAFDPVLQTTNAYARGAISIFHRGETPAASPPAARNRDIVISNNTIEQTGGPAIQIAFADHVQVTGNTIREANLAAKPGAGSAYGLTTGQPIGIDSSVHVVIDGKETP